MILEDATFKAFGYYPSELKPKSHKRIIAACDDCGKVRIASKAAYHSLCISCALKGNTHLLGYVPTEEHKAKLSEAKKGDKHPGWNGGPIKCICAFCGKEFEVEQNRIERGYGKYCSKACVAKGRIGDKAANWQGGISFEPYCVKFNEAYKNNIRNFFSDECFLCGKSKVENGKKLSVHHINYNKNCGCDGSKCICVPLCYKCHSKTNANRDFWQALIMEMLKPFVAWM